MQRMMKNSAELILTLPKILQNSNISYFFEVQEGAWQVGSSKYTTKEALDPTTVLWNSEDMDKKWRASSKGLKGRR